MSGSTLLFVPVSTEYHTFVRLPDLLEFGGVSEHDVLPPSFAGWAGDERGRSRHQVVVVVVVCSRKRTHGGGQHRALVHWLRVRYRHDGRSQTDALACIKFPGVTIGVHQDELALVHVHLLRLVICQCYDGYCCCGVWGGTE